MIEVIDLRPGYGTKYYYSLLYLGVQCTYVRERSL